MINTQSQNLSGQVLVTFNGTNGEYLDNVNFFGASCTKDCPTEAYGNLNLNHSPALATSFITANMLLKGVEYV